MSLTRRGFLPECVQGDAAGAHRGTWESRHMPLPFLIRRLLFVVAEKLPVHLTSSASLSLSISLGGIGTRKQTSSDFYSTPRYNRTRIPGRKAIHSTKWFKMDSSRYFGIKSGYSVLFSFFFALKKCKNTLLSRIRLIEEFPLFVAYQFFVKKKVMVFHSVWKDVSFNY